MATSSSGSLPPARHYPAIIAAAGVVTGCGMYALYHVFSARPATFALHRRNALHQRRRNHEYPQLKTLSHVEHPPIGALCIKRDGIQIIWNFVNEPMPSPERLRDIFGPGIAVERLYRESTAAALDAVIHFCANFSENPDMRDVIETLHLHDLSGALASGDADLIRQNGLIAAQSRWPCIDRAATDAAVERYFANDPYRSLEMQSVEDTAETDGGHETGDQGSSHGLRRLLYYNAENYERVRANEHRGILCDSCGQLVRGIRWQCLNCPFYNLCSVCEQRSAHSGLHIFAKIKIPFPVLAQQLGRMPLWYLGNPDLNAAELDKVRKASLCREYEITAAQLDAHYAQFTSLASHPWTQPGFEPELAIDHPTLVRAITKPHWDQKELSTGNLVIRRVLDLYDVNRDGNIVFDGYLDACNYLRGSARYKDLARAVKGFDFDDDGYVVRRDFTKMLQAKFELNALLIADEVDEQTRGWDTTAILNTSQPINTVFSEDTVPRGELRVPGDEKQLDEFGDPSPVPGESIIPDYTSFEQPSDIPDHIPNKDFLRRLITQADNDLIDPIFRDREEADLAAISSRAERRRWRSLIDNTTAPKATQTDIDVVHGGTTATTAITYVSQTEFPARPESIDPHADGGQNQSEHGDRTDVNDVPVTSESDPDMPSHSLLMYLRRMDEQDRLMQQRGGPGRLSIREVEEMAHGNNRIKGLVRCWLEHAHI